MNSELAMRLLPELIRDLENLQNSQEEINKCNDRINEFLLMEAAESRHGMGHRRKNTKKKEYWDAELSAKWQKMRKTEKEYCLEKRLTNKLSNRNIRKHIEFNKSHKEFDKALKRKRRAYNHGLLLKIESCRLDDPNAFWEYIKRLGPAKRQEILWEIEVKGEIVTDKVKILDEWKNAFEKLYSMEAENDNNEFKTERTRAANCTSWNAFGSSTEVNLNCPFTIQEVQNAVDKSKCRKAVGVDGIPNELLKHDKVVKLLHELFNLCLKYQKIPDIWRIALIKAIPKESGKVIDPLKYRGLALQCCIYKILSAVINSCVVKHIESEKLLSDHQNGF